MLPVGEEGEDESHERDAASEHGAQRRHALGASARTNAYTRIHKAVHAPCVQRLHLEHT